MPHRDENGRFFFNLTDIAERWGMSLSSVLRFHVGKRKLRTKRKGRSHLVTPGDLNDYEERLAARVRERIEQDRRFLTRLESPLIVQQVRVR